TGAVGLSVLRRGDYGIFTDINPSATANAERNIRRRRLRHSTVVETVDLFPAHKERVDIVVANPPYTDHPVTDIVERMAWDPGHRSVTSFIHGLRDWLNPGGVVFLSWANYAGFDFIEGLSKDGGFDYQVAAEIWETRADHSLRGAGI